MKTIDYLKYWRVVRYWVQMKYGLTQSELELLLFLYTEGEFTSTDFNVFNKLISWDRDRLAKLVREGFIKTRPIYSSTDKAKVRYSLTTQSKHIVNMVYRKLGLEEEIPHEKNPIYQKRISGFYTKYREMADKMNKDVRKARQSRHSQ